MDVEIYFICKHKIKLMRLIYGKSLHKICLSEDVQSYILHFDDEVETYESFLLFYKIVLNKCSGTFFATFIVVYYIFIIGTSYL